MGIILGFVPLIAFAALYHFVANPYVLMFFYAVASVTTADYWAKATGNDAFRIAGLIAFPLIGFGLLRFSGAYSLFLFGQLALYLNKPTIDELADASMVRRQFGVLFGLVGGLCMVVGVVWGIFNLMSN